MQLDKEKEKRQAQERRRQLARQIARELAPRTVKVLGGDEVLEAELREEKFPLAAEGETPELLIVSGLGETELPDVVACDKVLLFGSHAEDVAEGAQKLVEQGFYRNFKWKCRDRSVATALFCRQAAAPEAGELIEGYEREIAFLHEQTLRAEKVSSESVASIERLRSDLALSRSHEQQLETNLNSVTNSTF